MCNHTIPIDVLESASANLSSLTGLFSIGTQLEILDQLTLEYHAITGRDITSPLNITYIRDTLVTDLYETSQSIITALVSYIQVIANGENVYLALEMTDEDLPILDTFLEDRDFSDATVSRWLIERFLKPLKVQLQAWPLCLLFAREFREITSDNLIIVQALRHRMLPPLVSQALISTTRDVAQWKSSVERTIEAQRLSAFHLLKLESTGPPSTQTEESPYSIDVIQSAIAVADGSVDRVNKELVEESVAHFVEVKELSVRLRAALYKIVDDKTANSVEAKETAIPSVSEWSQRAFFGASLRSRDHLAAQAVLATRGDAIADKEVKVRLRSLFSKKTDIVATIERFQRDVGLHIPRVAKPFASQLIFWRLGSEMHQRTAAVMTRCVNDADGVAREIIASDIVWLAQLICSTFPEPDNAFQTVLQQISAFVINAPFHLRALLDHDQPAIIASIAQAERLASSALDSIAEAGEATDKIPDAAQHNPWHGWLLFPSEPVIVAPPQDESVWSETAIDQLQAAHIDPDALVAKENRRLGSLRMNLGCFAMPNIGLMSGFLQELLLRDGSNLRDPRANFLIYLLLEPHWTTGNPLNTILSRLDELITAIGIAHGSISVVSLDQYDFELKRSDWYITFVFALAMTCLGPGTSSLVAACIGNHLTHQSDGETQPLGVDDPYLKAALRVLTSKYPQEVSPPNVHVRRTRNNMGLLLSMRYLQSLPRNQYQNPRLDTTAYYAAEHPFYISPTVVSARFAFFASTEKAVNDILSAVSYATPG